MTPDTTIALRTTTGRAEGREGESLRDLVERLADEGVSLSPRGAAMRAIIRTTTGRVIAEGREGESLRDLVERLADEGVSLSGADLTGADLSFAILRDARLRGADLRDADLSDARLRGADLRDADLSDARLHGARLTDARLSGARLGWTSHDLVAELLRRAAGEDVGLQMIAELPLLHRDLCWSQFATLQIPDQPDAFAWACSVLRPYVTEGDDAPACLREVQP